MHKMFVNVKRLCEAVRELCGCESHGLQCAEAAEWPCSGALAEGPLDHEWMVG